MATTSACFCTGPQNGEPLCRCRMASVKVVDGRYVQTIDLGPAPNGGLSIRPMPLRMQEPLCQRLGTRVRAMSGQDLGPAD